MRRTVILCAVWLMSFAASAVVSAGEPGYLRELEEALAGPAAVAVDAAPAPREQAPEHSSAETPAPVVSGAGGNNLFPDLRARVTARRHTILSSQSTGRIEAINVEDGNRFHEGEELVRLDSSSLEVQRVRAEAFLGRQEVLYRLSREMADMQSRGEAEVEVARMEMEQARAELQAVELLISRTSVTAPFSGRVADMFVREKQYVAEGTPLLEILDDSTLELEFIVPSVWVRWFKPGFQFKVTVEENGKTYEAVLERLGGKVDPLSQSVKAYASLLDLSPDLMEGMSGTARVAPPEGALD